jgi:hypothetical protein
MRVPAIVLYELQELFCSLKQSDGMSGRVELQGRHFRPRHFAFLLPRIELLLGLKFLLLKLVSFRNGRIGRRPSFVDPEKFRLDVHEAQAIAKAVLPLVQGPETQRGLHLVCLVRLG